MTENHHPQVVRIVHGDSGVVIETVDGEGLGVGKRLAIGGKGVDAGISRRDFNRWLLGVLGTTAVGGIVWWLHEMGGGGSDADIVIQNPEVSNKTLLGVIEIPESVLEVSGTIAKVKETTKLTGSVYKGDWDRLFLLGEVNLGERNWELAGVLFDLAVKSLVTGVLDRNVFYGEEGKVNPVYELVMAKWRLHENAEIRRQAEDLSRFYADQILRLARMGGFDLGLRYADAAVRLDPRLKDDVIARVHAAVEINSQWLARRSEEASPAVQRQPENVPRPEPEQKPAVIVDRVLTESKEEKDKKEEGGSNVPIYLCLAWSPEMVAYNVQRLWGVAMDITFGLSAGGQSIEANWELNSTRAISDVLAERAQEVGFDAIEKWLGEILPVDVKLKVWATLINAGDIVKSLKVATFKRVGKCQIGPCTANVLTLTGGLPLPNILSMKGIVSELVEVAFQTK